MIPAGPLQGGEGNSLDAGSSAESGSGDFLGGNRSFSFAGPSINKAPSMQEVLLYAGLALAAWVVVKKVK